MSGNGKIVTLGLGYIYNVANTLNGTRTLICCSAIVIYASAIYGSIGIL